MVMTISFLSTYQFIFNVGDKINWAIKLVEMITDSERIFQNVQRDLKHWNQYAYIERLNPPSKELGDIGMPSMYISQ